MARRSAAEVEEENTAESSPRLAEHLVAHAAEEKQLLAMVTAGRLPHALLFAGPRGMGKATLAWRLARHLLVPPEAGGLFGDPLPPESLHVSATHPVFKRMATEAHPDFLVLEADDIKIDEVRALNAFLALTPAEGQWRVVIVDSADSMNRNAANALLKTLEEPPARAVLLLISHSPGSLLPTIRSRCRMMRVPSLKEAEFTTVLKGIAPDITSQQAQTWALLSGRSPGVALELMKGRADTLYKELLERVLEGNTVKNHAFADRFARKDAEAQWYVLERLFLWLLARIAAPVTGNEVYAGEGEALTRMRNAKTLDGWLDIWERAGKLLNDTNRLHLDKKQTILTLFKAVGR